MINKTLKRRGKYGLKEEILVAADRVASDVEPAPRYRDAYTVRLRAFVR